MLLFHRFFLLFFALSILHAEDAAAIVRKSVELDQANWAQAKDYTWSGRHVVKHLNADGGVASEKTETWETVILYGEPHRKFTSRNSKPLTPGEQGKEQEKLDKEVEKLRDETPAHREKRLAGREKQRRKDREFLREIPDLYILKLEREDLIDGHPAWVISATPRPGYVPKRADAKPLLKIRGRIWIDKSEYQWVRVEAETTDTISFGLFIARLSAGATLLFEQTRINDEIWLPKHEVTRGEGRFMGKKIAQEDDFTWSNFHKFRVDSGIVSYAPPD